MEPNQVDIPPFIPPKPHSLGGSLLPFILLLTLLGGLLIFSLFYTYQYFNRPKVAQLPTHPIDTLTPSSLNPNSIGQTEATLSSSLNSLDQRVSTLEQSLPVSPLSSSSFVQFPNPLPKSQGYIDLLGKTIIDSAGNIYPSNSALSSNILPSLGTYTNRFYGIFANGFIITPSGKLGTDIIPDTNNKYNLGDINNYFSSGYITNLSGSNLNFNTINISGNTSSSGQFLAADGTAALPSYAFINATGTGLYRPSDNILGISTAGVERMRVDSSGRVGIGTTNPVAALDVVGRINLNTSSGNNTIVGSAAGASITSGTSNVAFGYQALTTITTVSGLTAVGYQALAANTSGTDNTALGYQALATNTTGATNTAIGYQALTLSTASDNTAVGWRALDSATTGSDNTALGQFAMHGATIGQFNTGIGEQALGGSGITFTGSFNTAVGRQAAWKATSAANNVVVGQQAAAALTTGSNNDLIGYQAGDLLTTGSSNVFIGYQAGFNETTGSNKLYIANSSTNPPLIYGDFSTGNVGLGTTSPGSLLQVNGATALGYSASTAGPANGLAVSGNVGIGLTAPNFALSALGSQSTVDRGIAAITNNNTTDSANTVTLRLNSGVTSTTTNARFVTFYAGVTSGDTGGTAVGHINLNNAAVNYGTSGADFGERMLVEENTEPGDIVGIVSGHNSKAITGAKLLGVVSDTTGFTGNDNDNLDKSKYPIVGMLGQIRTKVSTENGPISSGDYLTSSSTPGVAMKATKPGAVVGKALEPFSGEGVARILAAVSPGFADPNDILSHLAISENGSLINNSPQVLGITSGPPIPPTPTTEQSILTLKDQVASLSARLTKLEDNTHPSSQSAILNSSGGLDASPSASLNIPTPLWDSLNSQGLNEKDATISGTLKVFGNTTLANTTIAGDLSVDGTLAVTGKGLSVIGTLYLQNGPLAKLVDLFNGSVTIDQNGTITANKYAASDKTLGAATLKAGDTSVTISTDAITDKSHVFIAPTTITEKTLTVVNKQIGHSFDVAIKSADSSDITFDWWIVDSK